MPAEKSRILVVAAHPDDELLGCGATVARQSARGSTIWSLVLGEGITSRKGLGSPQKARALKKLQDDSRKANAVVGVKKLVLKDFADNKFDSVPRLELVHAIEEVVCAFKPDTVYTHSSTDLNIDHQIVCEAVKTACRPLPGSPVRHILSFEIPSATEWRFDSAKGFSPNVFVDVSRFLDKKLKALAAYKGEMRPFPHPRSEKYIRALAAVRGGQAGLPAAEAFSLIRSVSA
ncbi:MAG: PIG-L family deacetylase [Elusimicrobia bacterium]|nr:PIG-L family deacetylase [Elusimicrobiota bacterium]